MIMRSKGTRLSVAAAVTLALVACGDTLFGPDPRDVEFAASLGIDLGNMNETTSGLFYRDDVEGTGEPAALGDDVTLTYTGWLVDGEEFDSGGFTATLGATSLIAGFTEGLVGMHAGGTRTIVIPAHLAYGPAGQGTIPGDAVLVFELMVTTVVKP
jgi:FKBP-type peptidyl-prolyl cis-trans isomerase FkpA